MTRYDENVTLMMVKEALYISDFNYHQQLAKKYFIQLRVFIYDNIIQIKYDTNNLILTTFRDLYPTFCYKSTNMNRLVSMT